MDDPHNGNPRATRPNLSPSNSSPHHTSSIPRPKTSSNSSAMSGRAASPLNSSPDAIALKRTRSPRSESPQLQNRPPPSPSQPLDRPSLRSTSTNPRAIPRPAKSNPAISAKGRSIKDLVAQFDQGETPSPPSNPRADVRSVSAGFVPVKQPQTPSSRSSDHKNTGSPSGSRIPTASLHNVRSKESLASKPAAATTEGNQQKLRQKQVQSSQERPSTPYNTGNVKPLFGEVVPGSTGESNVGFGIEPDVGQSKADAAQEYGSKKPDLTDIEVVSSTEPRSKFILPSTNEGKQKAPSDYEQPSTNVTTSGEDQYEVNRIALQHASRSTPTIHRDEVVKDSSLDLGQSATPATYSQRDVSPNNALGGDQRLKAYIKDLSPKKSPPLRSSRPRQQVSSTAGATEAAPSNSFERSFGKDSAFASDTSFDWSNHPAEQEPRSTSGRHVDHHAKTKEDAWSTKVSQANNEPQLSAAVYQRPPPALKVDVSEPATENQDDAPLTGNTEIEDESPTSTRNIPGGFPPDQPTKSSTDNKNEEQASAGQTEENHEERRNSNAGLRALDTCSATYDSQHTHPRSSAATNQVNGELDEAGTIHICLGENPLYDHQYSEWNRPGNDEALKPPFPAPNADERSYTPIQGDSSSVHSSVGFNSRRGSRAEILPDSDVRSIRSRIIEQYGNPDSSYLWPEEEFPQELQEKALDLSPDEGPRHFMVDHVPHPESGRASSELNFDPQLHQSLGKAHGVPRSIPLTSAAARYDTDGDNNEEKESPPSPPPKDDSSVDERINDHYGYDPVLSLSNTGGWQRMSQVTARTEGTDASYTSDQPSLPEIKDTGGGIDFSLGRTAIPSASHRASTISETNDSPWYGERSSQRTPSTIESGTHSEDHRGSTHRPFGHPEPFDTPASSTSQAQSFRSPDASSRNNSTDHDPSKMSETQTDSKVEKWMVNRRNVIQELCETEHTFSQDMSIIDDIYLGTAEQSSELTPEDIKVLFANTKQVVALSKSMYSALREASRGVYVKSRDRGNGAEPPENGQGPPPSAEADRATRIGDVFLSKTHEIERVYGEYMRNQQAANERLKELQKSERIEVWLKECRAYAADLTSAWSLDALIVKPAQRMTKYPLLLGALLKDTPEDHPNLFSLQLADNEIKGILDRINDQKRRHETLKQIMQQQTQQRRDLKFAKFLRLRGAKVKQKAGLSGTAYEDSSYVAITQKFNTNYFQLQLIIKDIEGWKMACDQTARRLNQVVDTWENMLDTHPNRQPELESKWRKWATTVREVYSIAFLDHMANVDKRCLAPLHELHAIYDRPKNLMFKRKQAVAEYANFKAAQAKGGKIDKKIKEQGENFLAINDSLKSELPLLYERTGHIGRLCQSNLILLKRDWNQVMYRKLLPILDVQGAPKSYEDIEKEFNGDFKYASAALETLPICNGSMHTGSSPSSLSGQTLQDKSKRPSTSSHGGASQNSKTPPSYSSPDFGHRGSAGSYTTISQPSTNPRPSVDNGLRGNLSTEGRIHQQGRHGSDSTSTHTQMPGPSTKNLAPPSSGTFLFGGSPQPTPPVATAQAQSYESAAAYSSRTHDRHRQNLNPGEPQSDQPTSAGRSEKERLFIAASLYGFKLDRPREYMGYPFLTYHAGEVFDVLDVDGELWFSRNQEDPSKQLGWIWEQHFAWIEDVTPGWQERLARMAAEEDDDD